MLSSNHLDGTIQNKRGSPGKNGTYRKSIQRRLIMTISKIVVSIVCYRFIASSYSIPTLARRGKVLQNLLR